METSEIFSVAQNNNGINSKDRVRDAGEVFTPDSIVCDMLKLCDDVDITTTFLEPSCGDGQFLIRILYNKLLKVVELPIEQREIGLFKAVQSIYGIDIQEDNIKNAKSRMLRIIKGEKVSTFDLNNKTNVVEINLGITLTDNIIKRINDILDTNIQVGNTLTGENNSGGVLYIRQYNYLENNKVSIIDVPFSNLDTEYNRIEKGTFDIFEEYSKSSSLNQNYSEDDEEDW